jgi:hypothetical protein
LVDDPLSFIADHYHTVVRVQVDSTKLVHAGLLCVKSLSALRLYASRSTGTEEARYMIIKTPDNALRASADKGPKYHSGQPGAMHGQYESSPSAE